MSRLKKQAWPTKDAMDQVYKLKLWGRNSSEFYSGEGSHLPEIVDPYIKKVQDLIEFNKEKYKAENLEFQCLNIAEDKLPKGDFAIIRQVLQHLSNTEIQSIINKLSKFKYILITEHLPICDFEPNKDIISGQGIRIKKQSGVNLTAPPFNLKVKEEKEILSFELKNGKGRIVTKLYLL